jgi:hypothetical protein
MVCGCESSPSATDASATDASVTDARVEVTADASEDSGRDTGSTECNALSNIGTVVPVMNVATAPATGSGGVIASGTYVLTAASIYTGPGGSEGPSGATLADTLVVADGGDYERVFAVVNGPAPDGTYRQNGRFVTDGASIEVTQTCPPGRQPFTSYDSDGTTVRIYAPAAGARSPAVSFEYTRQ